MVISNIKLGFAQKKVAALPRKTGLFDEAGPVNNVCVVLDEADESLIGKFRNLQDYLGIEEEDFKVIVCRKSKPDQIEDRELVFSPADINWRGKIKKSEVEILLNRPFDLLVVFTKNETKTVKLIAAGLKADLKAGRNKETSLDFNLIISTQFEEVEVFLTELKKYLKILNKI